MNYLAHAYLSFHQPDILAGNLISDFVKGRKKFDYSEGIQRGIQLHREIDHFTDTHPATMEARQVFRPHYRLYAGAFVDVVYDHFLAIDKAAFGTQGLLAFSAETYHVMQSYLSIAPESFCRMFPHMQRHNWLYNYQFMEGIEKSMGGVAYRAKYLTEGATAFQIFKEYYQHLGDCYAVFFPELKNFVIRQMPAI
jgi:acyl carrier protein phosphodiesterase